MTKVFLVEKPRSNLDLKPAEAFGELCFLFQDTDRRCSVFDIRGFSANVIAAAQAADYDPEKDFFCIAGSMITVTVALTALLQKYGRVNVLLYFSPQSKYVQEVLDVRRS